MLAIKVTCAALLMLPYVTCLQTREVHHKHGSSTKGQVVTMNFSAGKAALASSEHTNSSVESSIAALRGSPTMSKSPSRATPPSNATLEVLAKSTTPAAVSRQAAGKVQAGPIATIIHFTDHLSTGNRIFVAMSIVAIALAVAGCSRFRDLFRRCCQRLYCADTIPLISLGLAATWLVGSFLGGWAQIVAICLFVLSLAIDFAFFSKYESERDTSGDAWHAERAWHRATVGWQQLRQSGHRSAAPWQKYASQANNGVMAYGR